MRKTKKVKELWWYFSFAKQLTLVKLAVPTHVAGSTKLGKNDTDQVAVVDRSSLRHRFVVHFQQTATALNGFSGMWSPEKGHELINRLDRVKDRALLGHVVTVLIRQLLQLGRGAEGRKIATGPFLVNKFQWSVMK